MHQKRVESLLEKNKKELSKVDIRSQIRSSRTKCFWLWKSFCTTDFESLVFFFSFQKKKKKNLSSDQILAPPDIDAYRCSVWNVKRKTPFR